MDDKEFQRIKDAEKERLRSQKRLRQALGTLKRRRKVQKALRSMLDGAQGVLQRTDDLVDTLRTQVARQEARLEIALGDDESSSRVRPTGGAGDLEDEAEAVEARAEALVRQLRIEMHSGRQEKTAPSDRSIGRRPKDRSSGDEVESNGAGRRAVSKGPGSDASRSKASKSDASDPDASDDALPEKTIGRMQQGDRATGE